MTLPLCFVDLPSDISTWRLQDLYYGLVNFDTRLLLVHSKANNDTKRCWVLCPLSEGGLSVLADDLQGALFRVAAMCLSTARNDNHETTLPTTLEHDDARQ